MMGRVIARDVVAIRCELATPGGRRTKPICEAVQPVRPAPADEGWESQARDLLRLVDHGWSFVLGARLRAYCPAHADRCWSCTCRTRAGSAHLCTSHSAEAASLVWDSNTMPDVAREELHLIGASK